MADQKTISFRGIDDGLSDLLSSYREQAEKTFDQMSRSALSYTDDSRGIIDSIEEQIKLLKEKNRIETEVKRMAADKQFQASVEYGGEKEVKEATATRAAAISGIASEARENNLQIKILTDILETLRKSVVQEVGFDEAGVREKLSDYESGKLDKGSLSIEERTRLAAEWDQLNRGRGGVIREDQPDQDKPMGFWKTVGAVAIGTAVSNAVTGVFNKLTGAASTAVSASSGDEAMWEISGAYGGVAAVNATAQIRALQQEKKVTAAELNLKASTGIASGVGYSGESWGMDRADVIELAREISKSSGRLYGVDQNERGLDLNRRALDVVSINAGYDIATLKLMEVESKRKYSDDMSPIRFIDILKNSGFKGLGKDNNFVRLEELAEQGNRLVQEQSKIFEKVNYEDTAAIMAAFDKIGGSFADDPRKAERIMSINRGLSNPANEYQQAMNYAVLSGLNPGANLWDVKMMEEKGYKQPGFLSGVLQQLTSTGDEVADKFALKTRFSDFSYDQIETLYKGYKADPTFADNLGKDKDEIQKSLDDIRAVEDARSKKLVEPLSAEEARLSNKFEQGAGAGLKEAYDQISTVALGTLETAIKDLTTVIRGWLGMDDKKTITMVKPPDNELIETLKRMKEADPKHRDYSQQFGDTLYKLNITMDKLEKHFNPSNVPRGDK